MFELTATGMNGDLRRQHFPFFILPPIYRSVVFPTFLNCSDYNARPPHHHSQPTLLLSCTSLAALTARSMTTKSPQANNKNLQLARSMTTKSSTYSTDHPSSPSPCHLLC